MRRHHTRRGRFRVEIHGGEYDGLFLDAHTLEWALRWYAIFLRQAMKDAAPVVEAASDADLVREEG